MNCPDFQSELHEYVEGTISAGTRAAVEQHLTSCNVCRRAVEKEQKLAQALSKQLRQSSQALTLRADIRRKILAAAQNKSGSPTAAESIVGLWRWLRLAALPVSLLLIAGLLLAIHFSGMRRQEAVSVPVIPRISVTTPPASNPQTAVVVQMTYRLPTHRFHQEGNVVMDTLIDETVIASGTFKPGGQGSDSSNLEIKTPL